MGNPEVLPGDRGHPFCVDPLGGAEEALQGELEFRSRQLASGAGVRATTEGEVGAALWGMTCVLNSRSASKPTTSNVPASSS